MNVPDLERRVAEILAKRSEEAMSPIDVEGDLDILRRRATREARWRRAVGAAAVLVVLASSVTLLLPERGRSAPEPAGAATPSVSAGTDSVPDGLIIDILAGSPDQPGSANGQGADARFSNAGGIAVDPSGTVYVTDGGSNRRIRMITPDGTVTTLVDREGVTGAPAFGELAVDRSGVLFVAEGGAISTMATGGELSLLAGDPSDGCNGGLAWRAGTGREARLGCILSMAVHDSGTLYVAADGHVGTVSPDGTVMSLLSGADAGWPNAVAVDAGGTVYFTADDYKLRMLTPDGQLSVLAEGPIGENGMGLFGRVGGVAVDPQGSRIYVADSDGLNKVTPDGGVTPVADSMLAGLWATARGADGTIYAIKNGSAVLRIRGA